MWALHSSTVGGESLCSIRYLKSMPELHGRGACGPPAYFKRWLVVSMAVDSVFTTLHHHGESETPSVAPLEIHRWSSILCKQTADECVNKYLLLLFAHWNCRLLNPSFWKKAICSAIWLLFGSLIFAQFLNEWFWRYAAARSPFQANFQIIHATKCFAKTRPYSRKRGQKHVFPS